MELTRRNSASTCLTFASFSIYAWHDRYGSLFLPMQLWLKLAFHSRGVVGITIMRKHMLLFFLGWLKFSVPVLCILDVFLNLGQRFRCYNWVVWLHGIPFQYSPLLSFGHWFNNATGSFQWMEKRLSPFGTTMEVKVLFCIWFDCFWRISASASLHSLIKLAFCVIDGSLQPGNCCLFSWCIEAQTDQCFVKALACLLCNNVYIGQVCSSSTYMSQVA